MQSPRGLSETNRDARPSEIHRLGGLRGGASATAGSATPGGMVAAAMGSVASARDQRRNRIGRGGLGSAHFVSSVSALGYPASGGREERRCRLRAAMGEGAQAGREWLPPLARRERPNDPHNSNFPAGEVGDIERRPHSFVGSAAMAYVSSCHRRRAHRAMGGTRGEHSEGRGTLATSAKVILSRKPNGERAVSKWCAEDKSPQRSPPQHTAGDGERLPKI